MKRQESETATRWGACWPANDTGDVFAAYTFTLESGFPAESITTVLRSIKNCDQFIAEMKPMID
jgi:hypothetical protein